VHLKRSQQITCRRCKCPARKVPVPYRLPPPNAALETYWQSYECRPLCASQRVSGHEHRIMTTSYWADKDLKRCRSERPRRCRNPKAVALETGLKTSLDSLEVRSTCEETRCTSWGALVNLALRPNRAPLNIRSSSHQTKFEDVQVASSRPLPLTQSHDTSVASKKEADAMNEQTHEPGFLIAADPLAMGVSTAPT